MTEEHLLGAPAVVVGDVTGDGIDDWMTLGWSESGGRLFAGPWPGTPWAKLSSGAAFSVHAADFDGDGALDLVVPQKWESRVSVFYGPIAKGSTLDSATAPLLFRGMTDAEEGGLADLFGASVEIADVTGDGIVDIIVGAPAEAEEACFGTRDTVVFPGPHPRPDSNERTRWASDAPIHLSASLGECLGQRIVATKDVTGDGAPDLVVTGNVTTFIYPGPLTPNALAAPSQTLDRSVAGISDVRGTPSAELLRFDFAPSRLRAEEASGAVHEVNLEALQSPPALLWPSGRPATVPPGVFIAVTEYPAPALYLFPKSGAALAAPALRSMGILDEPLVVSGGDLDGDGRLDAVFGRVVVLCR